MPSRPRRAPAHPALDRAGDPGRAGLGILPGLVLALLAAAALPAQAQQGAGGYRRERPAEPEVLSPVLPEGFVADLVIAAPEIRWPSAVHCLEDGSLLVAEDPMDMVGPADQPIDRILKLVFRPRKTLTTVFADGLWAVFGIQSLGDEVLVVNMPHLTRLVDADGDGVAEQRDVLVRGLGPDPPGMEGGFNDHGVSGLSLGPDGWLYVSVGDKGIPRATGSDGSTVSLRGGGVVRVRPDGTRLELVASGTRNHLDVVLDERGDMFTLDNTDDGLGWWTRLTHVIEDGYYGYPFDYQEHPERMLPCMADYGGGAPAGGLHYGETAWPLRYRGSFFWCEWGQGSLRRFDLGRRGATFEVDLAEDFATAPEGLEFRPLDLCLSPDGRFMYVADWAHPGWQSDRVTGRVWRIRREGDDPLVNRQWGGLGEPPIDAQGWIAELGAEGRRRRERAQRTLAREGTGPLRDGLIELLDTNPLERRRRHALWALVQIGGDRVRAALERALAYPNEDTRVQALRGLRRRGRSLPDRVLSMVTDDVPHVRLEAATTAGWLGGAEAAVRLARALPREEDPWVRWAIRRALRRIGVWDERVLSWVNFTGAPLRARSGPEEVPGADLLLALRDLYELEVVERLAWLAGGVGDEWTAGWAERLAPTRARALEVLAAVHREPEPWDGSWWSTQPAKGSPPASTIAWEGTERVLEALRGALDDPAPEVRREALEGLRTARDTEGAALVRARYFDEPAPELRRLALEVLADLEDEQAVELLVRVVRDRDTAPQEKHAAVEAASRIATPSMQAFLLDVVREDALRAETLVRAIEALGRIGAADVAGPLLEQRLGHPAPDLRAAALRALVGLRGARAGAAVIEALSDPSVVVRRQAVTLAGELELHRALDTLLSLCADVGVRAEAHRALARLADPAALDAFLQGLGAAETREASRRGLRLVREHVLAELEARHRAGRLQEPLLGEVREAYLEPLPVLDWLVGGPFRRGACRPVFEGSVLVGLEGEGADRTPSAWRAHRADGPDGFVDLDELLSSDTALEAWATGRFELARSGALALVLGSDDSMTVWVDGREVHDFDGARAWGPDQDRVALELEAGSHELAIRIGQGVGDWAFSVAVAGSASGPLFQDSGLRADQDALAAYRRHALEATGDVTRGYRLFQDQHRLACVRCHRITTARGLLGERVGPALDGIGDRYDRGELITSILEPSSQIASGYAAERVWTRDGRNYQGQVLSETRTELVLVDASGEQHRLRREDVEGRSPMRASIMPDGYQALMSRQELADLVAFLESLKGGGSEPESEDP